MKLPTIFTIGHSDHVLPSFLQVLENYGIEEILDVRSSPYSRWVPQFSREALKSTVARVGIDYTFLGRELGARPSDPNCYQEGRASYACIASTPAFQGGIETVLEKATRRHVALMCAEAEPLECHRTILVTRELTRRDVGVSHILRNGAVEPHQRSMDRLKTDLGLPDIDLFMTADDLLNEAYNRQAQRIEYVTNLEPA